MAPLISIITITYNAAKVLPPTVDSIMAQSFRDFEHIVVDGASTDDTLAIARRNPSARILSEPDRGLYDAMNKGLHLPGGAMYFSSTPAMRSILPTCSPHTPNVPKWMTTSSMPTP